MNTASPERSPFDRLIQSRCAASSLFIRTRSICEGVNGVSVCALDAMLLGLLGLAGVVGVLSAA